MIIANPIYDVVFKYLLEDTEIARELLSTILGVDIVELTVKPQETLVTDKSGEIKIFHLDFKAVIAMDGGEQKTVLIELQKARQSHDILRFRKYLGDNYIKEEVRKNNKGVIVSYALEIVTIYILGFELQGVDRPVLKVNRKYTDAITQEEVIANDDFINKLTHECYTIQIPRLRHDQRNKLEEVLEVFSQDYVTDDLHNLDFKKVSNIPLVKKMVKRLSKAAGNEKIKKTMEAEDMIDRLISRELEEKLSIQAIEFEEKLEQKDREAEEKLEQKDREAEEKLEQKDREAAEKLEQKEDEIKQRDREIEALRILLANIKNQD